MTPHTLASFILLVAVWLVSACAAREERPADPQITVCQEQARGAKPAGLDQSKTAFLTAQADAFAGCLEAKGYAFDEAAMDKKLTHDEQVWNANLLKGEIDSYLARRRQELRLSPALWRPGPQS